MTVSKFRTASANGPPKRTKFAAVMRSREQLDALREALKDVDTLDLDLRVGALGEVQPEMMNGRAPDVLLVDLGGGRDGTFNELTRLLREHPAQFQVLATGEDASVEMIRRLMRLGIADFVPQPMNRVEILAGLQAALSKRPVGSERKTKRGKVLSFVRSCGGIGATTLAIQAAAELSSRSRKPAPSVCIIDFDLQFGSVAASLDLKPDVGLLHILEAPSRLDREFLTSVTMHHPAGPDIVGAPGRIVPIDALTVETATEIAAFAAQAYDYVIIDLPRVWTNWTLGLLKVSDLIILVTAINVPALQRCLQLFELMAHQELQSVPLQVIVNRFESGWTGGTGQAHQAEKVLGRKIDFFVRSDPKTATEARDRGVLLREVRSRSKMVRDMRRFVDRLIADFARQEAEVEAAARRDLKFIREVGDVRQAV